MRCSSRNRRHRSGSSNLYQSITLDTAVRPCNVIKRPISAKPARNVTASPEIIASRPETARDRPVRPATFERKKIPPTRRPHTARDPPTFRRKSISSNQEKETPLDPAAAALKECSKYLHEKYSSAVSMRKVFRTWNDDKDARMSIEELRNMLYVIGIEEKLGKAKTRLALEAIVSTGQEDSVSYAQFIKLVAGPPPSHVLNTSSRKAWLDTEETRQFLQDQAQSARSVPASDANQILMDLRRKFERNKLRQIFRHWDSNKSGFIEMREIKAALRAQGVILQTDVLTEVFNRFDTDKDKKISFAEFASMVHSPIDDFEQRPAAARPVETPRRVRQNKINLSRLLSKVRCKLDMTGLSVSDVFHEFDDDYSGMVSYQEFRQGLKKFGVFLTQTEFMKLVTHIDKDGDGNIDFLEFTKEMQVVDASCRGDRRNGFDFSQLHRRERIPSRFGQTVYTDTSELIRGPVGIQTPASIDSKERFSTESQQYRPTSYMNPQQLEKARKKQNYENRLKGTRQAEQRVIDSHAHVREAHEKAQARRINTLIGHRAQRLARQQENLKKNHDNLWGATFSNSNLSLDGCPARLQVSELKTILGGLKSNLSLLQQDMLPLHTLTERLNIAQGNIDKTIHVIQHIGDHFSSPDTLSPVFERASPASDEFLSALAKISSSITFLETHREFKSSKTTLERAQKVLNKALAIMMREFGQLIGSFPLWIQENDQTIHQDVADAKALAEQLMRHKMKHVHEVYYEKRMIILDPIEYPSGYDVRIQQLLSLVQNEKTLVEMVFGSSIEAFRDFTSVIRPKIETFTSDIESELKLKNAAAGPPSTDEISNRLELFSLLEKHANDFRTLLEPPADEKPKLLDHVNSFLHWVSVVVTQMLHKFREGMATGTIGKLLPKDGTVHQMSSNVVQFIRRLMSSHADLDTLLRLTESKDEACSFDTFIYTIISKLLQFVDFKAQQYKARPDVGFVFQLNNYFFIYNALESFGHDVVSKSYEAYQEAMKALIEHSFRVFLPIFEAPLNPLVEQKGSKLLTLESGRQLKEKFAKFNTMFDDLIAHHSFYLITERSIRQEVIDSALKIILNGYTTFYSTYSVLQFSKKNVNKYLRYEPSKVEKLLQEMYCGKAMH